MVLVVVQAVLMERVEEPEQRIQVEDSDSELGGELQHLLAKPNRSYGPR